MITKMKAFPIYPTMEPASYGVFECLSFDIIEFRQQVRSIDGYRYVALYIEHCTNKLMVYGMKSKDELLSTLKLNIHQYGPTRNKYSLTLNYLYCDSGSEQLELNFLTYCRTNNIYINASAPYKHQQNFIECFVGACKSGITLQQSTILSMVSHNGILHTYIHIIKSPVETRHDLRTNTSTASSLALAPTFHSTQSDMLIDRRRLEQIKSIHLMQTNVAS